jgi:hypothetical protein
MFTLLESASGAVFIDVLRSSVHNKEMGALFASNYNGTKFSLSLSNTNRDERNVVDVERVSGVAGVLIANQVANADEILKGNAEKNIVTRISFNDGT